MHDEEGKGAVDMDPAAIAEILAQRPGRTSP